MSVIDRLRERLGGSPTGLRHRVRRLHPRALALPLAAAVVALGIGLLEFNGAPALQRVDNVFLDSFVSHATVDTPRSDTIVIDIDEVSLSAVGQWPWPRYRVASMIQRVAATGPAAIGLDILFPESDRTSLANIQQTFKRDFGVDMAFSGVPGGLLDNDGFLGHVLAETDVVGATYYYFDHLNRAEQPPSDPTRALAIEGGDTLTALPEATGVMANAPAIASRTRISGFVNKQVDPDGLLRRLPMLIRHDGSLHPSLALATVMRAVGAASARVETGFDGPSIRFGSHRVPIDAGGFVTLRFASRAGGYDSISALDVLNGNFSERSFRGKTVFIGSSAVGSNDLHVTAVDPRFPGLKIHAVAAGDLLHDGFIVRPAWAPAAAFVACLGVAAAVSWLFASTSGLAALLGSGAAIALLLFGASVAAFAGADRFVSPGAPLLVLGMLFVLGIATRFAIERRRAQLWLKQLENARQVTMESMAAVAETRDPETGAHIKRTQNYVRAIARELQRHRYHPELLSDQYIELLFLSAPLHDIGKVGVPDHILLKPGRLTPDEMELMKQHAGFGQKIVFSTAERIEGDNFLVIAGEIAATHHEKWDGSGYPLGLAGEAIPLAGRIMAVADIYDALISRRCYKEPFPHQVATAMMREMHGTAFDPTVLDAFFRIESEIKSIAARFQDEQEAEETPAALAASVVERLGRPGEATALPVPEAPVRRATSNPS